MRFANVKIPPRLADGRESKFQWEFSCVNAQPLRSFGGFGIKEKFLIKFKPKHSIFVYVNVTSLSILTFHAFGNLHTTPCKIKKVRIFS